MAEQHELKCWFKPFDAIADGSKRFEWRKNDRGFAVGDTLILRRYDPHNGAGYTGEHQVVRVTYMLTGPTYGIPEGYCIMSIERVG